MAFGLNNYASQPQPIPRDSDLEHKRSDAREGENMLAADFHPCWLFGIAFVPIAMFGVLFTICPTMIADSCFFSRKRDSFQMGLVSSLRIFHARCRRTEAGQNNDGHMDDTDTETSLATEEDDVKIEHDPFPRRVEEEEFLVRLGFRWNGVSYVANHEESVSETVYQQLLAGKEKNTNNNNTTLPIVALLHHKTLLWNDGSLVGTKHLSVSGTTVVVGSSEQSYYSKSLLGDDQHFCNRLKKFFVFSCCTAIPFFSLAIILGARSNLEFLAAFIEYMLVGILLASYLQYRWWERNLRDYRVVVDGEPPTIYDELELGPTKESTSHATTMDGLFGTID